MISIKIPKVEDLKEINKLLNENKINCMEIRDKLSNSMIVLYDNSIIGFANYIMIADRMAILENVLVHKKYRNQYFGDGLVKAILNLVDKRGINKIYVLSSKKFSGFFSNIGFIKEDNYSEEFTKLISEKINIDDRDIYYAKLPEFFKKACKTR